MIKFEFTPEKEDYSNIVWYSQLRRWKSYAGMVLVGLVGLIVLIFLSLTGHLESYTSNYAFPFCTGFMLFIPAFLLMGPINSANKAVSNERLSSPLSCEADDKTFYVKSRFHETRLAWENFQKVFETPEIYFLILAENKNKFHFIPKRVFLSESEQQEFKKLLTSKIPQFETLSEKLNFKVDFKKLHHLGLFLAILWFLILIIIMLFNNFSN